MDKNFFETLEARRCVRSFKPKPIPEAIVQKILAGGLLAPSAGNIQPWKFYVIRQQETKALLARAAFGQQFLAQAPVIIVVVADLKLCEAKYGVRGRELYSVQDTAAAVENILLGATALELGGCWVGAFDELAVSQTLGLPPAQRPLVIVPLGYPNDPPRTRNLKPSAEVIFFD